jgi:aspartate/methionine/tyrosine aminotransferase
MPIDRSPLELWFTTHPGPHAHGLAGTCAGAPPWAEVAALLPADWQSKIDTGYAEPEGDPAMRDRVAEALYLPHRDHVLLTQGAVEANWLALAACIEPGMKVVIQTPIYAQLPCVAASLGATVVAWDGDLKTLDLAGAELLVINSPHNPTGGVFTAAELEKLVMLCRAAGCVLLADEVYRDVGEGEMPPSALAWGPEGVLVSGSMSKGLALPGLRLGWLAGDAGVLLAALPWREHTTLALAGPAVALAKALWPRRAELVAANQAIVKRNRALALAWAASLPGCGASAPDTAGVLLLRVPGVDDEEVAQRWYDEERGMVLPGSACGYPGHFRLGFGHRDPAALEAALASFAGLLS